jgi:hypothetical protein
MAEEKLPIVNAKMRAEVCSYVDEENSTLHLEISVPGEGKLKFYGSKSPN